MKICPFKLGMKPPTLVLTGDKNADDPRACEGMSCMFFVVTQSDGGRATSGACAPTLLTMLTQQGVIVQQKLSNDLETFVQHAIANEEASESDDEQDDNTPSA